MQKSQLQCLGQGLSRMIWEHTNQQSEGMRADCTGRHTGLHKTTVVRVLTPKGASKPATRFSKDSMRYVWFFSWFGSGVAAMASEICRWCDPQSEHSTAFLITCRQLRRVHDEPVHCVGLRHLCRFAPYSLHHSPLRCRLKAHAPAHRLRIKGW